jgi:small GTP-binding protein
MIQKKICMLGAYGVGKTSLVKRFVESLFDERYLTTIGVKIDKKRMEVSGAQLTLMIWDLAGEDELEHVQISHLRGASGYILVADGCRGSTVERAIALKQSVDETIGRLPFVLALNKFDLLSNWEISSSSRPLICEDSSTLIQTSAKTGDGVEEMFQVLATKMLA